MIMRNVDPLGAYGAIPPRGTGRLGAALRRPGGAP
jgi:hypothetical protein